MNDAVKTDRPKSRSMKPLKTLWPFLKPYRGTLIAAAIVLIIAAVAMLALPVAFRFLIDKGFAANDVDTVNRYFIWFFAIAILFGIFAALRFYLVIWLGERIVADIRNAVYRRVIRMDATFFEVTRIGEVLSRLTTDTTLVQSIAGAGMSIALRSTLNLFGGVIMLLLTSPKMTGYILAFMPIVIVPMILIGRRLRRLSATAQDKIADSSGLADETLNAIQTVQAYTLEDEQIRRFAAAVAKSFRAGVRRIRVRALMTAVAITLIFSAMTLVLWLGSHAVLSGNMTAGELGQFLMYAAFVGMSAGALSELWGEIQRAAGAMERLSELLGVTPLISAPKTPVRLPERCEGSLRFENVSFHYPSRPESPALQNLSLSVSAGEAVALVGPSGAGKSTCFQLLLRFFDPQTGRILIDEIDIADTDPEELRRQIGLVPQETVLFGETAMENIRYGRPAATDDEVRLAAHAAAADEFIERLPQGYETYLGERGMRLSGGQRQRIAIARAILKDPPILLLDEATSSLDAESERLVQDALNRLKRNRTTIVIAHRLATVLNASRIIVMDQAQIVATGTHNELIRSSELYARLAALQFGDAA